MFCALTTLLSFILSAVTGGLAILACALVACGIMFVLDRIAGALRPRLPNLDRVKAWLDVHEDHLLILVLFTFFGLVGLAPIRNTLFGCETCSEGPCVSAQERADRIEYERLKSLYGW